MARFLDAIDLPVPPVAAFDYLARFDHTAEWDPGVVEATRLDPGPLGAGSRFAVIASFLGRRVPLEYEITAFEPPHRLVLRGEGGSVVSVDTITFAPIPGGTRVCYDALLELRGLARIFDPLLQLLFQRAGRRAARGLREQTAVRAGQERRAARRRRAAPRDLSRAEG
jgi:hypothetical protein